MSETEGTRDSLACRPRRIRKAGPPLSGKPGCHQTGASQARLSPTPHRAQTSGSAQFLSLPAFPSLSLSTQLQDDQSAACITNERSANKAPGHREPDQEAGPSGCLSEGAHGPFRATPHAQPRGEHDCAPRSRLFSGPQENTAAWPALQGLACPSMSTDVWAMVYAFTCCRTSGSWPSSAPGAFLYKPSRGCVLSCFLSKDCRSRGG